MTGEAANTGAAASSTAATKVRIMFWYGCDPGECPAAHRTRVVQNVTFLAAGALV
jgi:hypothetical protein